MRIAIDARSLEGNKTGVGRYLENLLRVWKGKEGCEFILYFKDAIPEGELLEGGKFTLRKLDNPLGFSSNFFFQHVLLPYGLKKDKADFFFSPFYLRPFFCPVRSAIVLHDISYEAHPEWFDKRSQFVLRMLSKASARRADIIFTPSAFSKSEIVRYYGASSEKIIVTPLAPDGSFKTIVSEEKAIEVRGKYGLGKFVFSVGTVFSRRHIPEIIRAFGKYCEKDRGYQLMIVGRNETFPYIDIDAMIGEVNGRLGKENVIRVDSVSENELMALYSGCEAVIYLSDYEGFGLPVVEGQSFGKPVITSRNTSLIEVGGDSVEYVLENKEENIFRSLEKVLENEDYRGELVSRGKENLRRFDWKVCAENTLSSIMGLK
jgi:glycosyltransferase involved in cell wall biosynthesis